MRKGSALDLLQSRFGQFVDVIYFVFRGQAAANAGKAVPGGHFHDGQRIFFFSGGLSRRVGIWHNRPKPEEIFFSYPA
jgi:hypothetical protein